MAIHDLNGDGIPDVVIANRGTSYPPVPGGVLVFPGVGDGTFRPGNRLSVSEDPASGIAYAVAAGDFNGDAVEDVAAVFWPEGVVLFIGRGAGEFAPPTRYGVGGFPLSLVAADFNGDGLQDLALGNALSEPSVMLALRAGGFAPEAPLPVGGSSGSLAAADLDGDGRQDLVAALTNEVAILRGAGDGTFYPASRIAAGDAPRSPAIVDLNGDGRLDLVTSNFSGISVFLGAGGGLFYPRTTFFTGGGSVSVAAGDADGDGIPDLAVADVVANAIAILPGTGDGGFKERVSYPARKGTNRVALADFNRDGILDFAAITESNPATTYEGDVWISLGQGRGEFGPPPVRVPLGASLSAFVGSGDFNRDGFPDLVSLANHSGQPSVAVKARRPDGTFDPPIFSSAGPQLPSGLTIADFNDDGFPDVAAVYSSLASAGVLLGAGDGTFRAPSPRQAVGAGPFAVAAGDFNRDGLQDVAVSNYQSHDISILLGRGDGTFATEIRFAAGSGPLDIVVGDFNADGQQDLAVNNLGLEDVSVLLGMGDGRFEAQVRYAAGPGNLSMLPADFNGDGAPDLVVSGVLYAGLRISVLMCLGDGTFSPPVPVGFATLGQDLVVGDFDADGLSDLAVETGWFAGDPIFGSGPGGLSVLLADGDGGFRPELRFSRPKVPGRLIAGYFNADNKLDLAFWNGAAAEMVVLFNQSSAPDRSPTAVIQAVERAECGSPAGAPVLLDGSSSSDPDSAPGTHDDIVSFEWFEDFQQPSQMFLGFGEKLTVTLPLGGHHVALRVTDRSGLSGTAERVIQVVDTTPPVVSLALAPNVLWPPDHRMVDVAVTGSVMDACGPAAAALESAASSEPDDAPGSGDGNTTGDIQDVEPGTADFHVRLRAERSGAGSGRTYILEYLATDAAGNSARTSLPASVPHDLNGVVEPLILTAGSSDTGTVLYWNEVVEAFGYRVVRGSVRNLMDRGNFFELGPLTCIVVSTDRPNTLGNEDAEAPAAGAAFFYLAEYLGPLPSSYSTEGAAKERVASAASDACP